ncbi:leucine-rich repeat-containing protein 15-like [Solea solea]|uniref:leucine-rich repeat-containing protein 15-like n=1 Tax=Solea solea TaxID=90069 RepID=UPI00272BA77C|nr:leucine-rich repeat-containing protein 15-like [Solea solea]
MYVKDVGNINSTVFHSKGLASVTRLRMDGAEITGIAEGAFGSLQNLTSVSLMRNSLTQVNSNWFGRPVVLSELSLSENQIEAVNESMLGGFTGLTKLSLSKNRIRTIGPHTLASQSSLAELDLSENRLTRLSPQVLGSLRSTKIRLDGNPWDCSCAAQDSVLLIKGLHSRAQLDTESQVTCVTPSALKGRPVWNVTACETSPEPGSTSVSQSVNVKPTRSLTPAASEKVETTQSQPTTESSVQTTPTEGAVQTSHTGNTSFSEAETGKVGQVK